MTLLTRNPFVSAFDAIDFQTRELAKLRTRSRRLKTSLLRDELELKIKTNLPEVMLDGEDGQENMKSTLSLRYRIGVNDAIKLEIQSSYNLRTTTASHKIMFKLF